MASTGTPLLWLVFGVLIAFSLVLDLGIHSRHREMTTRQAFLWAVFWIGLAIAFGAGTLPFVGSEATVNYFTAYLLEKALSVDNLFVFIVLFGFFQVPREHQHRVLFWGILGALVMRALFIFLGVALLHRFHALFYVFGVFLLYTGAKLLFGKGEEVDPKRNFAYRLFTKAVRVSENIESGHFFVVEGGRRLPSRLLLVVAVVEATDLLFAVDSIPAVLAVTTDPFVVYTSNIFAILGLRSLYFLLASMMTRFRYLNVGLGFVLAFIGSKMLGSAWIHLAPSVSLAVVAGLLVVSVLASLWADRRERRAAISSPNQKST